MGRTSRLFPGNVKVKMIRRLRHMHKLRINKFKDFY